MFSISKVTEESVSAFLKSENYISQNTEVSVINGIVRMKLHGSTIAKKEINSKSFSVRTCGFNSRVTLRRLNGLPGVCIRQKDKKLYMNGNEWQNPEKYYYIPPSTFTDTPLIIYNKCKNTEDHDKQIKAINSLHIAYDESHLFPINGKFHATKKAIREIKKNYLSEDNTISGLEYCFLLESEIRRLVNSEF